MTPRERVMAAVRGEAPDRTPFAVWYHFHLDPPAGAASRMAEAELDFYHRYRPDLLKVMHDVEYEPVGEVKTTADWARLPVLEPDRGNFGAQLETLAQIRAGLPPDVPMIETVFNVYSYADKLCGKRLLAHIREDADAVHVGLRAIAASLARYAEACLAQGCDGIYLAVAGASGEGAPEQEYRQHFLRYDQQVLAVVAAAPLNVVHLHGYRDLHFGIAVDLPTAAVCWSDRASGPSLAEARRELGGCLMGGLDETRFARMSVAEIVEQGRDAISKARGGGFILAPGCAIPTDTDPAKIEAIKEAVGVD
jgi:uroporphyrinogen decarboxylase